MQFSGPTLIRLNDAEAPKVYKVDRELVALGVEPARALLRDVAGWPIAADGAERDFGV